MVKLADKKLHSLAQHLVKNGLLSEKDATEIQEKATADNVTFATAASNLLGNKALTDRAIAVVISQNLSVPLFDINAISMDAIDMRYFKEKLIRNYNVLPLYRRGNSLYIAISSLTDLKVMEEFQFSTDLYTHPVVVEREKLLSIIGKLLHDVELVETDDDLSSLEVIADEIPTEDNASDVVEDAPVVRFVNNILSNCIKSGASDVHFEPYEKVYRVRSRIDGVLEEIRTAPIELAGRISARLKVMSHLNIANRRTPQDGRMRVKLSATKTVDFRVNTCPTLFGEKIVLRILDPANAQIGVDALGYDPDQKELFLNAIQQPYGMVLVVGPTGSGKTVSLYTALNILNNIDRNISTAEDPVEISLSGINQVQIRPDAGLTFPDVLRAFLRQDPDVIMVGEIRDLETADIAVKASHTGHMVLSTLHTNDAPQTLTRLINMGISPFNIASAVTLIVAQRLARRLCNLCKEIDDVPPQALKLEGFTDAQIKQGFTVYKAVGCDQCVHGYKGRVGVYQVMPITKSIGQMVMEGCDAIQLSKKIESDGIANLRQSGLKKVMDGMTSIAEVNRTLAGESKE